jgi:hypothetical protein
MGSYKFEPHTGEISDISSAFSELSGLAEEMREGFDNMESNGLGSTPKCERYGEAADALENISEVEAPDWLSSVAITYTEMVNKRKGRGPSRDVRRNNAVAILQAALQAAQDLEDFDEGQEEERDEFCTELENAIGEAEGVEFPGMYG